MVASRTRVIIAGGGVLGTMHAVMARRRGFEVVQLEREAEARGASVRNFGLVWVSGRKAGPELSLALRARGLADPGHRGRRAGPAQRGGGAARRGPAGVRAAGPGGRPRGEPGAARRVRRRPFLPGRRDRRAAPGAARAARPPGRRWL